MSVLETDILEGNERFIIDMMKGNMLMEKNIESRLHKISERASTYFQDWTFT